MRKLVATPLDKDALIGKVYILAERLSGDREMRRQVKPFSAWLKFKAGLLARAGSSLRR